MNQILRYHWIFLLVLSLAAFGCGGGGEGGGGTSQLTLSLRTTTSSGGNSVSPIQAQTVTPSESYCVESGENAGSGSLTQTCTATPDDYNLGILAIYLVDCQDASSTSVTCDASSGFTTVNARVEIYKGSQVDMSVTNTASTFSGSLTSLSSSATVGGIQIVTAYYIEQKFPADGTTEGDKIMSALRGESYRICTTPDGDANMATRCGQSDAEMGDYLIDLDDDATFNYMSAPDAATVSEVTTGRPASYDDEFNDSHFSDHQVCFAGSACEYEYTETSWYDVAGHFALLIPVGASVATLDASKSYTLSGSINIANTFQWTDGADAELADASTCVEALIPPDTCASLGKTDKDSGSVGVYNPFYDTAFLPQGAGGTVTISESAE